ncbi:hypothetical protein BCEP4_800031 [Burkholderia cepacia]|nr:hypothetical protein BCEP4_800031 [Burkholderia cepacia]
MRCVANATLGSGRAHSFVKVITARFVPHLSRNLVRLTDAVDLGFLCVQPPRRRMSMRLDSL